MTDFHLDFIGDVHGHLDCLCKLLEKLGYTRNSVNEPYVSPIGRRVVFLGDYIDRGPNSRGVYHLVRQMTEAQSAIALLGNHELNALAFWTKRRTPLSSADSYYREHTFNKVMIHAETVSSFRPDGSFNGKKEFEEMLSFFRTLPLYLETPAFRAMHACADLEALEVLRRAGVTNLSDDSVLHRTLDNQSGDLFAAVDTLLKGPEMDLSSGISFYDCENVKRFRTRIRWWVNPFKASIRDLALQPGIELPEIPVSEAIQKRPFYGESERPAFFGHYWLEGNVGCFRENVCCVDYSIASRFKQGKLVAYRFDGEQKLSNEKFVVYNPYAE